jgi:hypothetical protein
MDDLRQRSLEPDQTEGVRNPVRLPIITYLPSLMKCESGNFYLQHQTMNGLNNAPFDFKENKRIIFTDAFSPKPFL